MASIAEPVRSAKLCISGQFPIAVQRTDTQGHVLDAQPCGKCWSKKQRLWLGRWPNMSEYLSSDPQNPCRMLGATVHACNSNAGEGGGDNSEAHGSAILANW